jgi:hypothetical protein
MSFSLLELLEASAHLAHLEFSGRCRGPPHRGAGRFDPSPSGQAGLGDPEAACYLCSGLVALPCDRNDIAAELLRIRRGHEADFASEAVDSRKLTGKE